MTPRGNTDAPVIVDSEPPLLFDGAALRAVREWRYTAEPNAGATERQAIRIVFKPQDESPPPDAQSPAPLESPEPLESPAPPSESSPMIR